MREGERVTISVAGHSDTVTIIDLHRHSRKALVGFDSGARLVVETGLLEEGEQ